jgi:DNA-binding NarL/FixJ family response regulator
VSEPLRVIVADDHPIVREGLVAVLGTQPDFAVVGEAGDGAALIEAARRLRPDVALVDLEMPDVDGVAAIRHLRAELPELRILVLTAYDSDERIIGAIEAGAHGYLLKGAPRASIFNAIRVVGSGGSLLEPLVAARLLQRHEPATPAETLSPREREVLQLIAVGRLNKEIGVALGITERTVKFHVSTILAKLGAGNRTEAVALAKQRGLLGA